MRKIFTAERLRKELRGIAFTLGLVALITCALFFFQRESGITHGSVIYLVPVVIAAVRWGIVSAIIAACFGVVASAFFFYPPLYTFTIADPREAINLTLFIFVAIVISQLASRLKTPGRACAAARNRRARPLCLLAPPGRRIRRLRHPFRHRGPPRLSG